ncbi:hypothetical protein QUF72_04555 [Desulfobacterales bacterium HSG2]|nr:hypothetical protein [Desulfobacterales bacterium HSG2]
MTQTQHYLHSLCRKNVGNGTGWYAPAEIEDSQQAPGYVIPTDETGSAFGNYLVEVRVSVPGRMPEWLNCRLIRTGRREFLLSLGDGIRFRERQVFPTHRTLAYMGRFGHSDFAHPLLEVEPEFPDRTERLFNDRQMIIIGCDPFQHYDGIMMPSSDMNMRPADFAEYEQDFLEENQQEVI